MILGLIVAALAQTVPALPELKVLWTVPLKSHSFGGGAVADVNGDGFADVAFCTYFGDSRVMVLSGKDGSKIWEYSDGNHCYDASCKFADVNGDGKLELVAPNSSDCRVLCFDAATGSIVWNTFLGEAECTDTPPWIGDSDRDGAIDIVVGTFKSKLFVLKGKDGKIARMLEVTPHTRGAAVQSCPLVLDLNSDGVKDFVAGTFGKAAPGLYAINGRDGTRLWRAELGDSTYHGPTVHFVSCTRDPAFEIGAYDGHLYRISGRDVVGGVAAMTVTPTGERYIMSPVGVLGSIPGKSPNSSDLRRFTACEHITRFDRDQRTWQVPIRGEGRGPYECVTRGLSIADLDGDDRPDLAYLTSRGFFRVINERDGTPIYEFDGANMLLPGQIASDGSHSPVLADFNGDGKLDAFFVVGGGGERRADGSHAPRYGVAVCITGFAGNATRKNSWTMFRHDLENTGNPQSWTGSVVEPPLPSK